MEEEAKYYELIRMVEDNTGDFRKANTTIDRIIENLVNLPQTAESIIDDWGVLMTLDFSEYDKTAYGVQDYAKAVYEFRGAISKFFQSDYTQSNLNNLKDQLRNNVLERIDIVEEAIDSMERISSVLEKLPDF